MTIGGRKTILRNCTKLRGMSGQLARQIRWDNCGLKSQLEEGSPMGLVTSPALAGGFSTSEPPGKPIEKGEDT